MYLSKVQLFEIDAITEQHRRNHTLNSKRHREMTDYIETNLAESGGHLRANTLREAVSMGLTLSSETDRIGIKGGWRARRFRFVLELVIEEPAEQSPGSRMMVTGWTDRFSVSKEKEIDDDTEMYVNHIVVVRDFLRRDRRGNEYLESKVFDNYQMLLGEYYNSRDRSSGNNEYLMRPAEVFAMIDRIEDIGWDADEEVTDTRTMFNTGIRSNNASNNQRMHFLKSLMDHDISGRGEFNVYGQGSRDRGAYTSRDIAAYDSARNNEVTWKRNMFFHALVNRNGDFVGSRRFTYGDLVEFTEGNSMRCLDDITDYTEMNDSRADESRRLNGLSRELISAFTICYEIPTIMADSYIAAIEFTIDGTQRDSRNRRPELLIVPGSDKYLMSGDFGTDLIDAFESRFVREVFDVISEDGEIPIYMDVSCEIGGLTVIEMEFDGGAMERHVFTTFASSMAAPVISRNEKSALTLAKNYVQLRRDVVDRALADRDLETADDDYTDRRAAIPKFTKLS